MKKKNAFSTGTRKHLNIWQMELAMTGANKQADSNQMGRVIHNLSRGSWSESFSFCVDTRERYF